MQPLEDDALAAGDLDLRRGVHQGVDFFVLVAGGGQIAGGAAVYRDGGLTVFVGNGVFNGGKGAALRIHPAQLEVLHRLGGSLQFSGSLVAVAAHGVEALDGNGDLLTLGYLGGCIDPGVIIGISLAVVQDVEVHHVAVGQLGVGDEGAVVAAAIRGRRAVIGIALVDIEAAGGGLDTKNGADPAGAAHDQIVLCGGGGKIFTVDQLVGLHQRVQRGNAVHLIREAVLFRGVRGNIHGGDAVEIVAGRLRTDGDIGGGYGRRAAFLLHGDGIDLSRAGVGVHAGPAGIAAFHGDHSAIGDGDLSTALILGGAHAGTHLIVLVGGGRRYHHGGGILVDRQGIVVGILVKRRSQCTGADGQLLHGLVLVVPGTAEIIARAGVHDANLVTGGQLTVVDGKVFKAFVGEPVVQRTHPAGPFAGRRIVFESVDLCDEPAFRAGLGISTQRVNNAGHYGGI